MPPQEPPPTTPKDATLETWQVSQLIINYFTPVQTPFDFRYDHVSCTKKSIRIAQASKRDSISTSYTASQ